ncbi:unnamed protein product, partial [marine sediment metagenome]
YPRIFKVLVSVNIEYKWLVIDLSNLLDLSLID